MGAGDGRPARPGRLKRRLDRIAVGLLMSVVAFVVERRLKKLVRTDRRADQWQPTVRVR